MYRQERQAEMMGMQLDRHTPHGNQDNKAGTKAGAKAFCSGKWSRGIDVQDFIQRNYTPYEGDESFLAPPTARTLTLWQKATDLLAREREAGGVLDIDPKTISTITAHAPGFIDESLETIVGLQTDAPLKRAIMPFGGIRMVETSLKAYGREMDPDVAHVFKYRKTHNDGVFDAYTDEMKKARHTGIITGLPDAYGRGRIIGDYRRVPLYGVDRLIAEKKQARKEYVFDIMDSAVIRLREEMSEQIRSLAELKAMAAAYGFDIGRPAENTQEAIQWLYFGYLAAIKEQNGAAESLGRVSTFLDIYAARDLDEGRFTEEEIQEMVDHFVMKLRLVRFLRTPAYDELFSGDPTWVTEALAGVGVDGRHMVTKMTYRFLHTLTNLGPAPEPNMTILWSTRLPQAFKTYAARLSVETSSIQYENDDLMRGKFGDDYGIACCVSAMAIGKQMQFFGARANLAKALLYAINGGRDEISGDQVAPATAPVSGEVLAYDEVRARFDLTLDWLANLYINTLNIIHYMHDKYAYERVQMALHDEEILRTSACGIAGLSVVVDSLSAIRHAKVSVVRDETGLVRDYRIEGDFPKFGNNDPAVDDLAVDVVSTFMKKLRKHRTYRNSKPTMSVLTITSNVVYGKKTGSTPDGRKYGEPFAPGANPMHGRDEKGCLASMASVAKLPYDDSEDGISYTFSIAPDALGKDEAAKYGNLSAMLDGYFTEGGHHINVNVLNKELLMDAMAHPEQYPQLTIRVSGYAVNFVRLTREQQLDVINRTFHERF
jgi:formate C-acetyltransferase